MDRAPGLALAIFSSSGPSRGVPSRGEAVRPFRVVYGQRAFELIPPTSAGLPGSVARVSLLLVLVLALGGSVDMSEAGHVVPARDTSAGEEPAVTSVSAEEASERPFPLNSRRLTGPYLMCIAKAMGLPTSGATDATRVMIDGKITEMGRDPRNVQVTVRTHPHGQETLSLRDVDGVFVDAGTTDVVPELEGDSTGSVNNEDVSEGRDLDSPVHSGEDEIADLRALLSACTTELKTEVSALNEEVHRLKDRLERETERVNEMWRMNCAQVSGFDEAIIAKDKEIEMLKSKVTESRAPLGRLPMHSTAVTPHPPVSVRSAHIDETPVDTHYTHASGLIRRGKAPPVNEFSGEDPDILLEDWLPSIERASEWNGWSEEDRMIQLAGHLKGRALQEWNLLHLDQRTTFTRAIEALCSRLDSVSKTVAAQDFRHTMQNETESVSDFIRRLERTFQTAYGRDKMSVETRDTLLYGQLQEGLRLQLMRGPAVSGAKDYQELCMASKNEEKRLANLKKRQEYSKLQTSTGSSTPRQSNRPGPTMGRSNDHSKSAGSPSSSNFTKPKMTCFYCNRIGHRAQDCRKKKRDLGESESRGPSHPATTKQIRVGEDQSTLNAPSHTSHNPPQLNTSVPSSSSSAVSIVAESCTSIQSPLTLLFSGSESETDDVRQIHITDNGSHSQLARVDVQGVPADGIIDTAADITIIGGKLFALVAATAKLRKKNFRKSDKIPRNYDRRTFHLDGCMEMDITFQDKTMNTTVYIKMDASDQLLLSEGVCRQLGVVSYHPSILAQRVTKKRETTLVPSIRVSLVKSVKLPPSRSVLVPVRLESSSLEGAKTLLIEGEQFNNTGLVTENALVDWPQDGLTSLVVTNMSGFTQRVIEGTVVGEAQIAEVLTPESTTSGTHSANVWRLSSQDEERRKKLLEMLPLRDVPASDAQQLRTFLANNHDVFSLEEGERGETSLVMMEIDTGDETPQKQPPRRMPFRSYTSIEGYATRWRDTTLELPMVQPSSDGKEERWVSPLLCGLQKTKRCYEGGYLPLTSH